MFVFPRLLLILAFFAISLNLSAQKYKVDRLKKAVEILGLHIVADSLLPEHKIEVKAKDGRIVYLRTDPMCIVEHIGIPLFSDVMRLLQPSPVYDFMEYAVLNWKYKVNPNQLYLSQVIFQRGSWDTLITEKLDECNCNIENREDKLYIVTWKREEKEIAVIGIPIDYELLNNDTRRNMENSFLKELAAYNPCIIRQDKRNVNENDLSIYGTEGLFAIPGKSYIIDLLNQNVYYKLITISETVDTVLSKKPVRMRMETIQPMIVCDSVFPAESFANLMMCNDSSVPDVKIDLNFHLSNYHHERFTIPLSRLKAFCRQQGCNFFFACNGVKKNKVHGVMFASNLPKGYNHLFSIRIPTDQLTSLTPEVQSEVYLYIPPIDKEKLFGIAPLKKSGAKFDLP